MMQDYNHTIKDAQNFADQAMKRIHQEGLPATPDIFELWFNYYSGENTEVARSIDIMVSQNFQLTLDRCQ